MAFKRIIDLPDKTAEGDDDIVISEEGSGVLNKTALQDVDLSILNNDENFISQLVEDTSPQLAADLDADSNTLKNVNQITNLTAPQNPQEAATKSYVDNTASANVGLVPVGAITPWLKNFTNVPSLPEEFVECNGQTINDAQSPLDGQPVPDLNGNNRFIRAAGSSGNTGGSLTHNHKVTEFQADYDGGEYAYTFNNDEGMAGFDSNGNRFNFSSPAETSYTGNTNVEPPYYDTVMVMRIK